MNVNKPTRAMFAYRRRTLRSILLATRTGEALEPPERIELERILQYIDAGLDVRKYYGIKPKRGAPRTTRGLQRWIAIDFWQLRLGDQKHPDKVACARVAQRWNLSESRVETIAQKQGAGVRTLAQSIDRASLDATLQELIPEYHRITAAKT